MSDEAFRLSRIYAAGWNDAQTIGEEDAAAFTAAKIAAMAPYADQAERDRWVEGFVAALARRGFDIPPP